jgi:hypothetical protein
MDITHVHDRLPNSSNLTLCFIQMQLKSKLGASNMNPLEGAKFPFIL